MREKCFSPDGVSDGDGVIRDIEYSYAVVREEFSFYGSEGKACIFKLFDGIKISVVALEALSAVEFFQSVIQAFRQCACDRISVCGYSDLSFVSGEAEFFQSGNSSGWRTGVIGCLETYAVCVDEVI